MKKIITNTLTLVFLTLSNNAFAYKYECTVFFYISNQAHKYQFNLDKYDSRYGERLLRQQLKSEGKDPQSVSCAVY
jgi:hypothetical protein